MATTTTDPGRLELTAFSLSTQSGTSLGEPLFSVSNLLDLSTVTDSCSRLLIAPLESIDNKYCLKEKLETQEVSIGAQPTFCDNLCPRAVVLDPQVLSFNQAVLMPGGSLSCQYTQATSMPAI